MSDEKLLELLVDIGYILKFDDFQEFVDGRRNYGDRWTRCWPKIATCENCQSQLELSPEDLNGKYISSMPFNNHGHYPGLETYLIAIIQCPDCETYFKYVSEG
jgi:hypothetical protein